MLYRDIYNFAANKIDEDIVAIEADTQAASNNTQKVADPDKDITNPEAKQSSAEKSRSIINEIMDLIANLLRGFTTLFDEVGVKVSFLLETDKGFISEYKRAKESYVPNKSVTLIVHKYDNKTAEATRNLFHKVVSDLDNTFTRSAYGEKLDDSCIIEGSEAEFEQKLLKALKAPDKCKNMNDYFKLMEAQLMSMNEKYQVTVTPKDVSSLEPVALLKTEALKVKIKYDKSYVYTSSNKISNNLKLVMRNTNLSDTIRNRAEKYLRRTIKVHEYFKRYLDLYYKVKISMINNARACLKKLYNF